MFVQVAPSILSANFAALGRAVEELTTAGADIIHVDVMDGRFVPNLTIGPPVIAAIREHTNLPLDVHLMIEEPSRYISDYRKAGADMITVHMEACTHLHRTITMIRDSGAEAGVALNPATSEETLKYIYEEIDLVLVMSVNPGFGGQSFISSSVRKVANIRKLLNDSGYRSVRIEVDGGVTASNAPNLVTAGAGILVAGSSIFSAPTLNEGIRSLRIK
ncbi:MAG: ribulose-phosphate 3-epimerase [Acidibacillus sp.]|uniref:Ribulose-phosphate 3-epimerase n=1 Tax=Sulfoacidibacillus ferrooxidans TaxID=2005001 RepID=A0A9X2AFM0_9BACL|nr:ribulose-phosphate 3-epimerase [Sulfoacidibacillus ferrooxidans]MCI0184166.1 Ribulose-phosphate 3-epimerase [Sulfoacidibacillus ferrooxidans]MCY0892979.1 ribulose-phosphate 3-epimerase [Acidibacillus sp.]